MTNELEPNADRTSLRDYYAAAALIGLLAHQKVAYKDGISNGSAIECVSFELADRMIKQRNGPHRDHAPQSPVDEPKHSSVIWSPP